MAVAFQRCTPDWYPAVAFLAHRGGQGAPLDEVRRACGEVPPPGAYVLAGTTFRVAEAEGGLRLVAAPAPLSAEAVRAQLARERTCVDVRVFPVIDSTNEYVLSAAGEAAASDGELLVAAETQTRGRGRWGRAWSSPPFMGLWFSWWCGAGAQSPAIVAAGAAVGTMRALQAAAIPNVSLRWPNDVCIGEGKAGGILVECGPGGYAVGVGLNVSGDAAEYVDAAHAPCRPVSVAQATGAAPERAPLLARVLMEMLAAVRALASGAEDGVLNDWRDGQRLCGKRVRVRVKDRVWAGIVREVDPVRGIRLAEYTDWLMPHSVVRVEEACER